MLLVRTVLRPSPIHGIGCFAEEPVARGTPVWRFVHSFDRVVPPSFRSEIVDEEFLDKYAQRCPETGYYVIDMDNARFMNHSSDPNVATHTPLFDPLQSHEALRDIGAGEEMTCDYRIGDVAPFYGFNGTRVRVGAERRLLP